MIIYIALDFSISYIMNIIYDAYIYIYAYVLSATTIAISSLNYYI